MTPKRCPYGTCRDCIAHFTREDDMVDSKGIPAGRGPCDFCRAFGHIPIYWDKLVYEDGT